MIQWALIRQIKKFDLHFWSRGQLSPHDLFPIFSAVPTVIFYFVDPKMFDLDWVGYAVFVYASFFIAVTWLLNRFKAKQISHIHWFGVGVSAIAILLYQYLVYGIGLSQWILKAGEGFGLNGWWLNQNWRVSIDLIAFSFFQTLLIVSFFTLKAIKKFFAPLVYSLLTIIAFLLDAFYPSASVAGFQILIPYVVVSVAGLLPLIGLNAQYTFFTDPRGLFRSIMVVSEPRFLAIEINWPCAGILSVLIYFAVLTSLMQTLDISKLRKTIYLTLGFLGTIFVNVLRIVALIVSYVYLNADFLIFHQYIGGLFFLVWITLFLSTIFFVERRIQLIAQRAEKVTRRSNDLLKLSVVVPQ